MKQRRKSLDKENYFQKKGGKEDGTKLGDLHHVN
jgi:hypothetical protein